MKKNDAKYVKKMDYEKDPRFVKFIKHRAKLADDPKNWIPWEAVKKEMETKYGVKFGTAL